MTKIKQCEPAELVPLAVTIWNISVIDSPDFIVMPIANENVFPENDGVLIHQWPVDTNHAAENLRRYGSYAILEANLSCPHQKMGANADGWIAAVRNDTAMIEIFDYDSNAIYPDGGTSATTFTAGKIGELECLSPLVGLMVGQSIEFDLVWDLMDLAPAETNEESRAVEIDSHVRKLQRR
jgi:hypothetical protein